MKSTKKIVLKVVLTLVVITGLAFYVRYEISVYNALVLQNQQLSAIQAFLAQNFPDQVNTYNNNVKVNLKAK